MLLHRSYPKGLGPRVAHEYQVLYSTITDSTTEYIVVVDNVESTYVEYVLMYSRVQLYIGRFASVAVS